VARNSIALASDSTLVAAKQTPHQEEAGTSKENQIMIYISRTIGYGNQTR